MTWYYPILHVVCVFLITIYMEHDNRLLIGSAAILLCIWMWLLTCDVLCV